MSFPNEYLYSREHEWVSVNGDVATIGITTYAQNQLGEIVFVECSNVGTTVEAGGECGTLESVKAVGTLYSPISGEVVEVNTAVVDDTDLLNEDPHGSWLIRVRVGNASELEALLNADQYADFVQAS